ncbi:hypothetical protein [Pandoraea pnomenusa]
MAYRSKKISPQERGWETAAPDKAGTADGQLFDASAVGSLASFNTCE